MAKKKINQMPKVNEQFTGSYVQNLVGNKPVTPVAQVQASAINPTAVGGNSYSSYVNSGAAVTPTAASAVTPTVASAVTPTATGATSGQYTNSLVNQPKTNNANEGGFISKVVNAVTGGGESGDGESGDGKVEVLSYTPWLEEMKSNEESVVEAYDAAINYAEKTKEDAYKKAEDQYSIALRDAQANFRANQPTYGVAAEQLLASGLTGGGYSDYLAGKAYEARTEEINAARSQQSYAQYLADQNYNQMMYQAKSDKYNQQAALDQWKLEYGVQLDAEYKAKVEEILAGIAAGSYTAEIAKKELENYAPNGVISENIIGAIDASEYEYWKKNDAALLAEYMTYVEAEIANGGLGSRELMRDYLKNSSKLTDTQIEVYLDAYYNADGSLKDAKYRPNAGNGGSGGNSGSGGNGGSGGNSGSGGNGGSGGNSGSGGNGLTNIFGNNKDSSNKKTAAEYFKEAIANGTNVYEAFKNAMGRHDIGNYEDYKLLLDAMDTLADEGKIDAETAKSIRNMTNGLVVGSGVFESNIGPRKNFKKGDNFNVQVGDVNYRVDSEGEASDTVKAAAKDVKDGVVFGYGSELYVKVGETAYKIKARDVFGNKDYDKLWKAVYGEAIDNIGLGKGLVQPNEGVATSKEAIKEKNHSNWFNNTGKTYEEFLKNADSPGAAAGAFIGSHISNALMNLFGIGKNKGDGQNGNTSSPDGGTGLENPQPNGDQNTNINNNVTTDGSYSDGGNNVASDIGLALSEGKKTLTINDTTYGVRRQVTKNTNEDRWIEAAISYAKESAKPGTVFVYKDKTGDHWCYRDNDVDGEAVIYELGTSDFMTFKDNSDIQAQIAEAMKNTPKLDNAKFNGNGGGLLPKLDAGIIDENFAVLSYNNKNYRVNLVAGDQTADKNAMLAGKGYEKGDIYTDGNGNIWISRGSIEDPLKVVAREGTTLYGNDFEKLNNAIKGVKTETAGEKIKGFFGRKEAEEKANANNAKNTIDRAYGASVASEGLLDRGLEKGDWFKIEVEDDKGNSETFRVKSGGKVETDSAIYADAADAGIYSGEVFSYGDQAYIKKGQDIYAIDTRFLSPLQEKKLVEALSENAGNPSMPGYWNKNDIAFAENTVADPSTYKSGDKIEVEGDNNKNYTVKIATKLIGDSEAYTAATKNGIGVGKAFVYRNNVYVLGSTNNGNVDSKKIVYKLNDDDKTAVLKEYLISGYDKNNPIIRTMDANGNRYVVSEQGNQKDENFTSSAYNNRKALDDFIRNGKLGDFHSIYLSVANDKGQLTEIEVPYTNAYTTENDVYKKAKEEGMTNDDKYEIILDNNIAYVWMGDKGIIELEYNESLINYLKSMQETEEE